MNSLRGFGDIMGISDRIEGSVENWRAKWGKALYDYLINVVRWGLETLMNILGQALAPKLTPFIEKLEETGEVPSELQPILNEIKNPTGQVASMLGMTAGGGIIGGAIGKVIDAMFNPLGYAAYRARPNLIPDLTQLLSLWLRGHVKEEDMPYMISSLGYHPDMVKMWEDLAQIRLDPQAVITAWRRDKEKYEPLFKDLKEQGWTDDRIEALKFYSLYYPSPQELIHWQAKEVFEPDMISRYGLAAELENVDREAFYKAGMSDEQINNHWYAHWEHASWIQVREMLHREQITEEEVWDYFRVVEIPPYWRQKLINVSWNVPTRVDVRRWWDMRTITEERLREVYAHQGYHGKDLDDYVLWTKVYTAFPDLLARFKNGWITEENVRSELVALGMPSERVEEMIQTKIKSAQPERVEVERTATATEIMKAVKKEYITWAEGVERLGRMGYSPEEADFKLRVYIGVSEGSPDNYVEFLDWTERYRQTQGLDAFVPSPELLAAAIDYKDNPSSTTEYRYRQLLIAYEEAKKKG